MADPSRTGRPGAASASRSDSLADRVMFRVGALGLGMLSGLVIGALFLLPLSVIGVVDTSPRQLLIASTLSSALCGLLVPRLALTAIEGLIHFFVGLLSIVMEGSAYDPDAPLWLRAAVVVGMLYAGGTVLLIKGSPLFFK